MKDPAARNCMWRFGFKNPKNWDDTGLYCGSFGTQWETNKGACGICGDDASSKHQPHMDGGKYANGIIARRDKSFQSLSSWKPLITDGGSSGLESSTTREQL